MLQCTMPVDIAKGYGRPRLSVFRKMEEGFVEVRVELCSSEAPSPQVSPLLQRSPQVRVFAFWEKPENG
jgi:hypothetical protein